MIELITGQPGHGKTLRAIWQALEYQKKGRTIYAHGIRGLDYAATGFQKLDDPKKWQDLPDGSVVLLDEFYSDFPRRAPGARVPEYVEKMATHRHRGFDFILVCQQAKQQVDIFLLGLIERHIHVRRKFGLKASILLTWDKFSENLNNSDIKPLWRYPKDLMARNLYESTVQDTTQKRVPWFYYAIPLVVLAMCGLGYMVYHQWVGGGIAKRVAAANPSMAHAASAKSGASSVASEPSVLPSLTPAQPPRPTTAAGLARWLEPRIPGEAWTAPAFDGRPVVSVPRTFCVATVDRCSCLTEQGTRAMVPESICRIIVKNGVYDPTLPPSSPPAANAVADNTDHSSGSDSGHGASVTGGSRWPTSAIPQTFTPPEQTVIAGGQGGLSASQ